jgi:histidinol-phosphate aminotransferase
MSNKINTEKLIRNVVKSFEPYVPGKPIDELKRELGLKKIYKLASNENSLGCSKYMISKLKKNLNTAFRYPESSCFDLKNKISKKLNIQPNMILFGNGSDELIEILGRVFLNPDDEIITSKHSFVRYKMSADLMCAKTLEVPMTQSLVCDTAGILKSITDKTKIIFIGNPNNPTGTYISDKLFSDFIKNVPANVLVVMDEAYYEFVAEKDYPDTLKYLETYPNLIILRTFSKLYSLAGLRVGYMISSPEVIECVDRIRPPFNVNILAQAAANYVLDDKKHVSATLQMIDKGKKYLYSEFEKLNIPYIKTSANFILFKTKYTGKQLFQELLKLGIIIRPVDEYELKEYARVTIGTMEENKAFINAIKKLIITNGIVA